MNNLLADVTIRTDWLHSNAAGMVVFVLVSIWAGWVIHNLVVHKMGFWAAVSLGVGQGEQILHNIKVIDPALGPEIDLSDAVADELRRLADQMQVTPTTGGKP
jgi:hypothetical protein